MARSMTRGRHGPGSRIGTVLCWVASVLVAAVCLFIIGYLLWQGMACDQLEVPDDRPGRERGREQAGGMRTPMAGTAILVLLSILIGLPLAVGAAIFLAEYMDERWWLTRIVRIGLETLASVPSVVFGMFGLAVFTMGFFKFLSASGTRRAGARRSAARSSSPRS